MAKNIATPQPHKVKVGDKEYYIHGAGLRSLSNPSVEVPAEKIAKNPKDHEDLIKENLALPGQTALITKTEWEKHVNEWKERNEVVILITTPDPEK